jgi:hypothetical protein
MFYLLSIMCRLEPPRRQSRKNINTAAQTANAPIALILIKFELWLTQATLGNFQARSAAPFRVFLIFRNYS